VSRLVILIFFENRGYALSRIILNIVGYHVTFLRTTHTLVAKLDLILDVMPPSLTFPSNSVAPQKKTQQKLNFGQMSCIQ
jgi:hypothetical protein